MTVAGQAPIFDTPDAAMAALAQRLVRVDGETIPLARAAGRVLRVAVVADRDSPAADVSAMDGYALRIDDLATERPLPVSGESAPGHPPPAIQPGHVVRIFTGAVVPQGMELVVRREDTAEMPHQVRLLQPTRDATVGLNIRRRGENAASGSQVLCEGSTLHAGAIAAAATFGAEAVQVSRTVRVAIIVTGDELRPLGANVAPWQLRDSNGPTLLALLAARPWIEVSSVESVEDSVERIQQVLNARLRDCDAVVLTGGVSMGDYDHVPDAVRGCGGDVVFHKLPIRPGKPILGAATRNGRLVLGLPGNPVSVAVGARRILLPLLGSLAGMDRPDAPRPTVTLASASFKTLPLYWYRLIRIDAPGKGLLVPTRGSGDVVSMAASTGFIEQPPNDPSPGPWPYWAWSDE